LVQIREIRESDAERYLNLNEKLIRETDFLLVEPGERKSTVDDQRKRIVTFLESENSTIFVVEHEGELVGHLVAISGHSNRNKHSAYLVVGILQEFWGKGIGIKLFEQLEGWARHQQIHRIELTVMVHNESAVALYKKMGFEIEGLKKHSLLVREQYVDEFYMTKLLS
jgi:RimJ/RimL family protein N-acetyltransferase